MDYILDKEWKPKFKFLLIDSSGLDEVYPTRSALIRGAFSRWEIQERYDELEEETKPFLDSEIDRHAWMLENFDEVISDLGYRIERIVE